MLFVKKIGARIPPQDAFDVMVENLEHRHLLAALVGVDFDVDGLNKPTNWEPIGSGNTPVNLMDLRDEDGFITEFDLTISGAGGSITAGTAMIDPSTVPTHDQSLDGLDGQVFTDNNAVTLTWSGLTTGTDYEVYVFGLEGSLLDNIEQDVTITGANSVSFRQTFAKNKLFINDQIGSSSPLSTFAKIIEANNETITIQIDPVTLGSNPPGQTLDVSLGGVAIREVPATPELTLSVVADSVSEGDGVGATTATVSRNGADTTLSLDVTVTSDDTDFSAARLPGGGTSTVVTIPAGRTVSDPFDIDAVDDAVFGDPTETVTFTAAATGFANVTDTLDVVDDDAVLTLAIADSSVLESAGTTTAVVTRTGDTTNSLTVNLSSNSGKATVQGTVTIDSNETSSAPFNINIVDNPDDDGTSAATITATAAPFVSGVNTVTVVDDDVTVTATNLSLDITAATLAEPGAGTTATVTRPDIGLIVNHVDRGMTASDSAGFESISNDTRWIIQTLRH